MRNLFLLAIMIITITYLSAEAPVVTGAVATQRTDGSGLVDITYDVSDSDGDEMTVTLELSSDGGNTFTITPDTLNLSGDVGSGILSGTGKSIVWDVGAEAIDFDGNNFALQICADDGSTPNAQEGFVLVPAGSFEMGRTGVAEPVHTVNLDAFYIGICEVTHQEVIDVFNWTYQQGYVNCSTNAVTNAQGSPLEVLDLNGYYSAINWNGNQLVFAGSSIALDVQCPAMEISWHGAVAYCNFLSLQQGLTPCYNLSNWNFCDFSANGYRLPTEAEWEYSARGATNDPDYLYAGSDTIEDVAWYTTNSVGRTHIVGDKGANSIGTHDQSGNVREWCWDYWGPYSSEEQTNPTGSSTGLDRVVRGGNCFSIPSNCEVSFRYSYDASGSFSSYGFRLCRTAE